jgi:hypothetical protein
MSVFAKLAGTTVGSFILQITGVRLKNSSGTLDVRNNADTAFAPVNVSTAKVNGTTYGTTLQSSSSQTTDLTITLPATAGSPNQVLQTNGSGVTTWVDSSSGATDVTDTTSFAFGSSSTISMFTLPANAVILSISVIVDTAFDGTPSMSVGTAGNASKYVGSSDTLLTLAARYDIFPADVPDTSSEALQIAYTAGSATVGAGRVLVNYSLPS